MWKMAFFRVFSFCMISVYIGGLSLADDRGLKLASGDKTATKSEQRAALVIGNGTYESAPLRNPPNDAQAMAGILRELGFDVAESENLDQKAMKKEIQAFGQKLLKGGIGLFYYAGHGMQVNGRNYLIPVGAQIEHEKQVEYEAVDVGAVLAEMDNARNRLNIVILDACRDNPFARSFRSSAQGLASMNAPTGTLVAYATAPGSVANDGTGENGIYTGELIKTMTIQGLKVEDVFKQVRSAVRETTQGRQVPWESSSLEGDFYFKAPAPIVTPAAAPERTAGAAPSVAPERAIGTPPAQSPHSETVVRSFKIWKEPVTGMEFVWLPGGCFLMGSPQTEAGREADESPVNEVCLDGFWMAKTEVTNGQYRAFHKQHNSRDFQGSSLNGDNQPVVYIAWEDADSYAQWLTTQSGGQNKFRLPTEAEWEYACRAGSDTSRYWGDDTSQACEFEDVGDRSVKKLWGWEDVHACDDGYGATAGVGSFRPNAFGLYDMLGNVWEWCLDVYSVDAYVNHDHKNPVYSNQSGGSDRVIRGGNWNAPPHSVRCARRGSGLPKAMNDDLGFRLVRQP
jgi:formylglycine-generating enzyme required for sulfatase activity